MAAHRPFALTLVVASAALLAPPPPVASEWYLAGGGVPDATLTTAAPGSHVLPNYDPGRDALPGVLVARGGAGVAETDPARYQQWTATSGPATLEGAIALELWAASSDFDTGRRGVVEAFLLDCDATGTTCLEIARGSRDILDWSGGWGSWSRHVIGFGRVDHTVPDGRSLAVRVVVGADSDGDMLFAYGAFDYSSRLTDQTPDDITVDCDFGDWLDGQGTEYLVVDEGGPDDWKSPARLDVTVFGVATNQVDSLHVLMGLDDDPTSGGTFGTMIDTDIDNNANFALVAHVDGSTAAVELYECGDTLSDGCSSPVLRRTLPASQYCAAPGAGPWNGDTLVEADLPFTDLDLIDGPVYLTALISYAAASLLTSPKDSVFGGEDEDYQTGILFDATNGAAGLTGGFAPSFDVRRSSDPATVRTTAAHATVTQSPFDDQFGTLTDGEVYYYVAEQTGGVPVELSAHANSLDDAVRLGFDDGDPQSAPVDAFFSAVATETPRVPADGTTAIPITIVPRDAQGRTIGAGCDVQVDTAALWPGVLAGPVEDNLDGSYTLRVVSTLAGGGDVLVTLEGVPLASEPQLTFTSP